MKGLSAIIFVLLLLPAVSGLTPPPEIPCCSSLVETGAMGSFCDDYNLDADICEEMLEEWERSEDEWEDEYEEDYYPDDYDRSPPRDYRYEERGRNGDYREKYEFEDDFGKTKYEYRERDDRYEEEYRERDDFDNNERYDRRYRYREFHDEDDFEIKIMIEEWLDEIDEDTDALCPTPDELTNKILDKMKYKYETEFQFECDDMEERANECEDRVKDGCSRIEDDYREYCDRSDDEYFWECMDRSKETWTSPDYNCEDEWERNQEDCEEYYRKCLDKEGFVDDCFSESRQEFIFEDPNENLLNEWGNICTREWEAKNINCEEDPILCEEKGIYIDKCYSDFKSGFYQDMERQEEDFYKRTEESCKSRWEHENEFFCEDMKQRCDGDEFFDKCEERMHEQDQRNEDEMERFCKEQVNEMKDQNRRNCDRMQEDKQRCYEDSSRRCERMHKEAEMCSNMDWSRIESEVSSKVERHCKLVAKKKDHVFVDKLLEIDDKESPGLDTVIEDNAEVVVEVAEEVDIVKELEAQKNAIYKVMRFFGFKKEQEQQEIQRLSNANEKMDQAIERLEKVQELIENEEAKIALGQATQILKTQRDEIQQLIAEREGNAVGIVGRVIG